MPSAEKASKDSAQSPACSRNARPSATWPRAAVRLRASPANTSGGQAGELLERRLEGALVGPVGLLRGRRGRATTTAPTSRSWPKPRPCSAREQSGSTPKRRSAAPGGRGGRSDRKPGERAVPRLLWRGRWVCPRVASILYPDRGRSPPQLDADFARRWWNSQAASLRARASSRTAVTARFTSRRAASAVTPSVSPTSR